jgi:alkanesulfonate monooxygenase
MPGEDFEIVFAGSSDETIENANTAGNAHYYAMETLDQYIKNRHKILVDSAIKATIIVEPNSMQAWKVTEDILDNSSDELVQKLKQESLQHESQNQKHQQALHNFSKDNLVIEPNIWSGFGLVRAGGITAMVGDYQEVANLIKKFHDAGLNRLLLGGTPELYYVNNFVNGVMPILKEMDVI